ncbi:MAG: xanthine dehydrogenase small subunit [Gammaproteobacteria bacterium]|nr:xanthine dehydrogenase small subunit [Gammaproteobacteria bacterium]
MSGKTSIRFILDGNVVEITDVDPTRTVLQFLREDLRRKGSKEGCAEGDCGACTVVIAELRRDGETTETKAINSCIQFLATLDGKELITVESLSDGKKLHPAQQAMVEQHGSQCGFCTPGFVMSLYALYEETPDPTRRQIDDALSGNLCRCTGYRPIIEAASRMHALQAPAAKDRAAALRSIQRQDSLAIEHNGRRFFAPRSMDEFAKLYCRYQDATVLAGGTDVGLWVTKQHRELNTVIYTGQVVDMQDVSTSASHLELGAAATLTDVAPLLIEHYPGFEEMLRRFASPPIRNAGTLGGNIANGSPIGDSMAALMVVDTSLVLRCGEVEREVSLSDFYHDYMVNDLRAGEFVARVRVPLPRSDQQVLSQKWSKRFDQDISAVCTAYRLQLEGNMVKSIRLAYGGLAATVQRAPRAEAALLEQPWSEATVEAACEALAEDFKPIGDMRASAEIRMLACQNLLRRFYAQTQDSELQTVYSYGR